MDDDVVRRAAAPLRDVVSRAPDGSMQHPTPCPDYDVRGLLNHLLFWAPSLTGAARKQPVPPPAEDESAVDLVGEGWRATLLERIDDAVAAWSDPDAWEGATSMTGAMELPGSTVGGMQLCELVLHGWDLSRATGVDVAWDEDVVATLHEHLEGFAALGRDMGAFGSEVDVPPDAPAFDRLLGLAGRDPSWSPAAG